MASYTVYFTKVTEISVKVDAEGYEAAIEVAYDEIPSLGAQASGWGQSWTREEGDVAEPEQAVNNDTGETEWETDEHWIRALDRARR